MRHTIIIALLLITLFPNTALAQWGFDAVSVEAYINDHKKQRSYLAGTQHFGVQQSTAA